MGDMWRSQKMTLVQMIVQNDAAHAIIETLGKVGLVQFRDVRAARPCRPHRSLPPAVPERGGGVIARVRASQLNAGTSLYKRSFVDEVRKCEDLSRIMRDIFVELQVCAPLARARRAVAPSPPVC